MPNLLAKLEALLFVHGEPIHIDAIAETLGVSVEEARTTLEAYEAELGRAERGLMLLSHGEKYQLITKPEVHSVLTQFIKQELDNDLSPASLETLALITYLGPISKARIEYFRGVNSTVILRNLGMRALINRIPDPAKQSAFLYEPSFDLLRHLGVSQKEDLPDLSIFRERFEARAAADPVQPKASPELPEQT